jgi:hypothetical protein
MTSIELPFRSTRLVSAWHHWFGDRPRPADRWRFAFYYHCAATDPVPGFVREVKHTPLLDISPDEDTILAGLSKTTRYEVRRGGKEGLTFGTVTDRRDFLKFYNDFANAKQLGELDSLILNAYWPHMVVTQVARDGEVFVMHAYVVDRGCGRVNVAYSASQFRGLDDKETRRLYSRANRWLHFEDMCHFRREGFRCYDFGGYAKDTTDKSLQAVNEFKDSFGGRVVEESNYTSATLHWLRLAKSLFRRG